MSAAIRMPKDLIRSEEAARMLRVNRYHVALLCRQKKLRAVKVGLTWVISRRSVERYARADYKGMGRPRAARRKKKETAGASKADAE